MTRVLRLALAAAIVCQGAIPARAGARVAIPASWEAPALPLSPVPVLGPALFTSPMILAPSLSLSALPSLAPAPALAHVVLAPAAVTPVAAVSTVEALKSLGAGIEARASSSAKDDVEKSASELDAGFSGSQSKIHDSAPPGPASALSAASGSAENLRKAGFSESEAAVVIGRTRRRAKTLAAAMRKPALARSSSLIQNAYLLTVLLGARPATLLFVSAKEAAELQAAARLVNPRIRIVTKPWGSRKGDVEAYVYDPDLALDAMRAATRSGEAEASFSDDLKWIGEGPHARRRARRWLDAHIRLYLKDHSEHRLGVLFGYPANDVADMIRDEAAGTIGMDNESVSIHYQGNEADAISWLAKKPGHPATRRAAALYQAALDEAWQEFRGL